MAILMSNPEKDKDSKMRKRKKGFGRRDLKRNKWELISFSSEAHSLEPGIPSPNALNMFPKDKEQWYLLGMEVGSS